MTDDFLKDLNPEQKKAVLTKDGPMIILAGAGSGKTRVITYRVINLLLNGVKPENILCVTFTNKAANEMKERVKKNLSLISHLSSFNSPTVSTFHSLCAKILRRDGKHINLSPGFVIYDTSDQLDLIKQIFKLLGISPKDYKPSSILATISQAKNELITSADYLSIARGHFQETAARVYVLYEKLLKENEALDFDDLLLKTAELFSKNKEILNRYQELFKYILIDEYQDTNHAQYYLTKMLALKYNNICVVGDFSQSIYSWRGADFRNLTKFKEDFKNTQVFSLSQNYRSTKVILDAASAVISNNTTHPVLSLWTDNPKGEDLIIYEAGNERDEAQFILNRINDFRFSQNDFKLKDAAVLYRINSQSRVIEETFLQMGIPYLLVGGTRFYERKEIKDLVSYLRVLANPKDQVSRKRIEKLGKARFERFGDLKEKLEIQDLNSLKTNDILTQVFLATDYLS
ncbi:MAG: UvrD-helicase domain-containing protein, partial [Patescibacteria group bacterium]|nr:UvrD-helicase domain-containing protein [Patescibacteria group bacterium]